MTAARRVRAKLVHKHQQTKCTIQVSAEVFQYLTQQKDVLDYSLDDTIRRIFRIPPRIFVPPDAAYYKNVIKGRKTKIRQYVQHTKFILIQKGLEGDQ